MLMEGGRQQIALRRVLASEPVLRHRQEFGDQCGDGFRCDGLELAAKGRNLPMNPLQLGTEVFDRKLVERHNRLIASAGQLSKRLNCGYQYSCSSILTTSANHEATGSPEG